MRWFVIRYEIDISGFKNPVVLGPFESKEKASDVGTKKWSDKFFIVIGY